MMAIALTLATLSLVACDSSSWAAGESMESPPEVLSTVDLGILFSDERTYVCLPLVRLGLSHDSEVNSVSSSCVCLHPRIVSVVTQQGATHALRVDFKPNTQSEFSGDKPQSLAVVLRLHLSSGDERSVILKLLVLPP